MFMSPLSISVALAMTYLGARNNTKSQMSDVLHFNEVKEGLLHEAFNEIRLALSEPDQPYKLHIANKLFGDQSYTFLADFLGATEKHYGAQLHPVNFGDSSGSTNLVNQWVADNTAQKITELIPPGVLNDLTKLVLVNAVYFKGDWEKKFDKNDTKDEDFHVSTTETVRVPLMHKSKAKVWYGVNQDLNCQAIELPYAGERLSMFVILPIEVNGLGKLESSLSADEFVNTREKFRMQLRDVHIWLPKFKLDEKLGLNGILAAMGITDMFDGDSADFSGMDGTRNLFVSKVLHQAVVDVNEEGTEAAAATAVVMMLRCAPMFKDPFEFRADRPFLFFIKDNKTNSVLFLGRLVRP